ncbi:nicotinate-nucleotide adenylyltransferase [Actinomadura alba]|uniref:Probable nicotinate-nucleotide adenylyltransferase n=2 Tax=Actinomadura alba TaxID=406431 RepID=A0ABR7LKG7_9ACTN|nr:nicotinate-nucleotide adenylyltransferase [Actinomadura alba]
MGGTFDPIHNVHLLKANKVARCLGLDEVVFVPAGRPWQKDMVSPPEQRLAMTTIATRPHPRFSVSRIEIDRSGPTYTVDTLRELRRTLGWEVELFFIAGADVQARLHTWRDAEILTDFAHFVFCSRPGYVLRDDGRLTERVTLLQIPHGEISSTLIRRRVAAGEPIRHLVPGPVASYIEEHGLYRR